MGNYSLNIPNTFFELIMLIKVTEHPLSARPCGNFSISSDLSEALPLWTICYCRPEFHSLGYLFWGVWSVLLSILHCIHSILPTLNVSAFWLRGKLCFLLHCCLLFTTWQVATPTPVPLTPYMSVTHRITSFTQPGNPHSEPIGQPLAVPSGGSEQS